MQFFLFVPLIVIIYMKNIRIFRVLYSLLILGGAGIVFGIWYTWKLNAGILALEDYYMFTIDI